MKIPVAVLLASLAGALADTNATNDTATNDTATDTATNSTGGLETGALVGIILGSVFGVLLIGAFVMYWFSLGPSWFPSRMPMRTSAMPTMAVGGKLGPNNMPMMSMRVSGDDSL